MRIAQKPKRRISGTSVGLGEPGGLWPSLVGRGSRCCGSEQIPISEALKKKAQRKEGRSAARDKGLPKFGVAPRGE